MAFIMIATGASSRSRVRTLSVRPLLLVALSAALGLLAAGSGLGYWLAEPQLLRAAPAAAVAPAPEPPRASLPYTLEQLGAISGRLFRLESEAAQLSKRIGIQREPAATPSPREVDRKSAAPSNQGASGGPLLAPRTGPGPDAGALDAKLALIEQQIAGVAEAARQHSHALMRLPSRLPVADADLTASFGNRIDPFARRHAFHEGLDFAAEAGTPITAAAGGTVVFAGYKGDYGWLVEIDHGNGLATRYAHASKLLVKAGQVVVPGERIARVGSSGRSTGPHLHFEVLQARGPVDPKRFLAGL